MPGSLTVGDINGAGLGVPNLVINPEFTINQRGAASRTATSSAYNFDRWYYDGTNLLQGIESLNLRPGTYVISWVGSSTCAYSLNTAASSAQGAQSYTAVTNGSTITIGTVGSNNLWLRFTGDLANLNKIKLVLGSVATPFEHRPYGAELALCQRYFCKTFPYATAPAQAAGYAGTLTGVGAQSAGMGAWTPWRFPTQMRATPTVTTFNPTQANANYRNLSNTADLSVQVPAAQLSADAAYISAAVVGAGTDAYGIHATAVAEL